MSVKLKREDLEWLREQFREIYGYEPEDEADEDIYLSGGPDAT